MASPMGDFGILPVEIRLLIWENLLSDGAPAFLQTCRGIYEDIADRLYSTFDIDMSSRYEDPWLTFRCRRLRLSWDLRQPEGRKKWKRFWMLSYEKIKLFVNIYAPDPKEPGEIILLWQKAQSLVDILNRAKHRRPQVNIRLHDRDEQKWEADGIMTESITYPGHPLPDFIIAFLPFCRLTRVETCKVTSSSRALRKSPGWDFLRYGGNFIANNGCLEGNGCPLSSNPKYREITRLFDSLPTWIADTDFFLETSMDGLPGNTAALLRRDRFAHWYQTSDRLLYDSPYQRKTMHTIEQYPATIAVHDPRLSKLSLRYKTLKSLHYVVATFRDPYFFCAVQCDARKWYKYFYYGIYEFTQARVQEEEACRDRLGMQEPVPRDFGFQNMIEEVSGTTGQNAWALESRAKERCWFSMFERLDEDADEAAV
ncbi:hypothetical protein BO70DRAFT_352392 [Aspergillus heteromorphus CBS 117.55]|uniref:Uncharacterized protein n=1 Tax=Aspergillus heteromorphus CBS 117.55 TaxID=1448321 RepID=A0A317WEZ7_9EURO|nr:uncharacterized protein BO70DRAFT_352392 [Aspergillus heteromorphus CBS 117.55]PWY83578.1 hypothetical protein BO70DRAFT_352392 [Aspergillus heteromorphus CBS 117.55]